MTMHSFKVTDINGNPFNLNDLKGKKVMVVNTASECGLTPQYEQLQALFEETSRDQFMIVGFPANNIVTYEFPGTKQTAETLKWVWYDGIGAPEAHEDLVLPNGDELMVFFTIFKVASSFSRIPLFRYSITQSLPAISSVAIFSLKAEKATVLSAL